MTQPTKSTSSSPRRAAIAILALAVCAGAGIWIVFLRPAPASSQIATPADLKAADSLVGEMQRAQEASDKARPPGEAVPDPSTIDPGSGRRPVPG